MAKLASQLQGMINASEYDGVLVERDTGGITDKSQVINALAGTGLDGTLLDIEVVNVIDVATKVFTAIGHAL